MKKTTWLGIVILSGCAADPEGEKGGSGLAEFADCDGYTRNGAETDIASDPLNCGGCGHACEPAGSYGGAYCEQGKCILVGCPTYEGAVTAAECALDPTTGCPQWRFSRDERYPTFVGEVAGDETGPEPLMISGVGEAYLVVRVNEIVSDELLYATDLRGEAVLMTSASDPSPDYHLSLDVDAFEYRSQCPFEARNPYDGWQVSGTCWLEVRDSFGWYDDSFDLKIHVYGRGEEGSCEPWRLAVL